MGQQLTKKQWIDLLLHWELAKHDTWTFLKYFARTFDEHHFQSESRQFPATAYARVLCRIWDDENIPVAFFKKSRQVRFTWQTAAMSLHRALNVFNWRQFDQSKKEEDAAESILIKQIFMYEQLMQMGLPDLPEAKMTGDKVGTSTNLEFPKRNCSITAIPQGPDIVRAYTCSFILADEINHQPKAEEGFDAAAATINGGGKWWGVGTSNGRTFMSHVMNNRDRRSGKVVGENKADSRKINPTMFPLYSGDPDDLEAKDKHRRGIEEKLLAMSDEEFKAIPLIELIANVPGMDYWITCDDKPCFWLHYSADPDKSPDTILGREWVVHARKLYTSQEAWNREMEGNDETFEGRPVISNWSDATHLRAYEYDSSFPVVLGQDYGTDVNATFFCNLVNITPTEKQLRLLDERIGRRSDAIAQADDAIDCLRRNFKRGIDGRNIKTFCDPNGNQESDTTSDKTMNTRIKIQREKSGGVINPQSRKFGCKDSTQAMEDAFGLILSNGEPAVVLHPRCTYARSVFSGGLHYAIGDQSGHYAKDGEYDHGGDALRYIIANVFDHRLLAGTQKKQVYERVAVKNIYTGRIVRWHKKLTPYGVALRRQGLVNVR